MSKKLFGTDGIRGVAGTYPMTAEFCQQLATTLSHFICTQHKRVAIARDTRISGSELFKGLADGFVAQGIDVIDLGIIPTPLCTTLTPTLDVDMSIMITASHNPYQDNGLKLISATGDKFSDEQTNHLENLLSTNNFNTQTSITNGNIIKHSAGYADYIQIINNIISTPKPLQGMKIALDCANGAFCDIMPKIYEYLGAEIIVTANHPDGYNINKDCGSQHTENLRQLVINHNCDLGIAVDGDGDRINICNNKGVTLDGDQVIAGLATYYQKHQMLTGNTVVATTSSNLGLGKYLQTLGLNFIASAVGERYVIEKMREHGSNLGGEESGHIVMSDFACTGDALLASIFICLSVGESKQPANTIYPIFKPYPNKSYNLRFADINEVSALMEQPLFKQCVTQIKQQLEGHGVIVVRKSGTEPVLRLKVEDENAELVKILAEKLMDCIKKLT